MTNDDSTSRSEIAYRTCKYSRAWWLEKWHNLRIRTRQWLLEDQANRGLGGPPNNWRSVGYIKAEAYKDKSGREYDARYIYAGFCNDAHEICLGIKYAGRGQVDETWKFSSRADIFRRIAIWYLWRWAWGEWCGLRRWLYYKDLHRRVSGWAQETKGEM